MTTYGYLGDSKKVNEIFARQLQGNKCTVLSLNARILGYIHELLLVCHGDERMFQERQQKIHDDWNQSLKRTSPSRNINIVTIAASTNGMDMVSILESVLNNYSLFHCSPNRITFDLIIYGIASVHSQRIVNEDLVGAQQSRQSLLNMFERFSKIQPTKKSKLMANVDHDFHFKLTNQTFAALVYPHLARGIRSEAENILGTVMQIEGLQYRKDWWALEEHFCAVGSIEPFFYSFQKDFAAVFPDLPQTTLLLPLYSLKAKSAQVKNVSMNIGKQTKNTNKYSSNNIINSKWNKQFEQSWLSLVGKSVSNSKHSIPDHLYHSGISKFKGVNKHLEKKRIQNEVLGKKGKFHKKTNPKH
ncbi:hypothetical protein RFI_20929 [Reticulomyxa filosa]|uniref:Uncharacterized protein n=1 Tax=Reticulomyxa filosa TaxID=46433 RepID=X6MTJ1_RETFI|nr:hypothetical protein RFI_20929 [Reticulomyxa filosa]|eukprot:ETO16410.1 hypothetical protein RFI_20929 [Reticulomyxa filosa]